jgi:hypothetical protein
VTNFRRRSVLISFLSPERLPFRHSAECVFHGVFSVFRFAVHVIVRKTYTEDGQANAKYWQFLRRLQWFLRLLNSTALLAHRRFPMQLINCPACRQQISRRAKACPSCGHPITKQPPGVQLFFAVVFLASLVAIALQFALPGGNAIVAALLGVITMQAAAQLAKS